jgi:hypothetical protein
VCFFQQNTFETLRSQQPSGLAAHQQRCSLAGKRDGMYFGLGTLLIVVILVLVLT